MKGNISIFSVFIIFVIIVFLYFIFNQYYQEGFRNRGGGGGRGRPMRRGGRRHHSGRRFHRPNYRHRRGYYGEWPYYYYNYNPWYTPLYSVAYVNKNEPCKNGCTQKDNKWLCENSEDESNNHCVYDSDCTGCN